MMTRTDRTGRARRPSTIVREDGEMVAPAPDTPYERAPLILADRAELEAAPENTVIMPVPAEAPDRLALVQERIRLRQYSSKAFIQTLARRILDSGDL